MAKATKFSSLKAAQDWLVARGFAKTEVQHVWQNGSRMAAVSLQLGGVMPRFLITVENETADNSASVFRECDRARQGWLFGLRVMASDLHMVDAFRSQSAILSYAIPHGSNPNSRRSCAMSASPLA